MSEAELPAAVRIERLNRFIDRLRRMISDHIKVYVEADSVIQGQSSYSQIPFLIGGPETHTPLRILDKIQVIYANLKSEYWPQLGQARLEYRVLSTAEG